VKTRTKTDVLRVRCEPDWKKELAVIASFKGLDTADIVRIALSEYVHRFKNPDAQR
jgi:hypothetical protein